jgi:putative nucleotidyltransferase-like protein
MMDPQQVLSDLIVGCAPVQAPESAAEWDELVALAQAEGVAPLLASALRSPTEVTVPAATARALEITYRMATFVSLRHQGVREQLCVRLDEQNIPVLLLKGAALALTCYDDPVTRPMGDLDLLVPRSRLQAVIRVLEEHGFCPLSGSFATELRSPRGHLVAIHPPTEALVELHWELKLLGRAQARAMAEIWAGARRIHAGDPALVMRLGHTLPLLCAHMLLQHRECRLLWLYDVHRVLLTMDGAEAALARETALRWRLGPCVALALLRVRELFGTVLPDELSAWAEVVASRGGLQARAAAQALASTPDGPSEFLMSLLLNRTFSPRRILVPTPDDLRLRLGLSAEERVGIATYAAFLTRRLRNGPLHFRQILRIWRPGSSPPCSRD